MNHLQGGRPSHTTLGKVLNTHVHLMTTNMDTPLVYPASKYGLDKALAMQRKHPNTDPASWELTEVAKLRPAIQVHACSLKLIGELRIQVFPFIWIKLTVMDSLIIQVFSFTWSKLTMMERHRTSSPHDYGEDYYKENFPPHDYGEDHPQETYFPTSRVYVDNLAIAGEGPTKISQDPVSMFKDQ